MRFMVVFALAMCFQGLVSAVDLVDGSFEKTEILHYKDRPEEAYFEWKASEPGVAEVEVDRGGASDGTRMAVLRGHEVHLYQELGPIEADMIYRFEVDVRRLSDAQTARIDVSVENATVFTQMDKKLVDLGRSMPRADFDYGDDWTTVTVEADTRRYPQFVGDLLRVRVHGDYFAVDNAKFEAWSVADEPKRTESRTFYVSASQGSDANEGLKPSAPLASFARINASILVPGDCVLLKRGDVWTEMLHIWGTGEKGKPLHISAYGEGAQPQIVRADLDHDVCLRIENPNHIRVDSLDMRNAACGILLHYDNTFGNEDVLIEACYFKDMPMLEPKIAENDYDFAFGSGIHIASSVQRDMERCVVRDLTVRNCTSYNCSSFIESASYFSEPYPGRYANVRIEDITIHKCITGGIGIRDIDGGHVKRVRLRDKRYDEIVYGSSGGYFESIHNFEIDDCAFADLNRQPDDGDACGIDIDGNCRNVTISNVVMHDNDGPGYEMLSTNGPSKEIHLRDCTLYKNGINSDRRWGFRGDQFNMAHSIGNAGTMDNIFVYLTRTNTELYGAGIFGEGFWDFEKIRLHKLSYEEDAVPYMTKADNLASWQESTMDGLYCLESPRLFANSHWEKYVRLRQACRVGSRGKIYFRLNTDEAWDEKKSVVYDIVADASMHEYVVDLRDNPHCKNIITGLRLVPSDVAGAAVSVEGVLLFDGRETIPDAPGAPVGLTATPIDFRTIRIDWEETDDEIDEYQIERSTDGRVFYLYDTAGPDSTSYETFDHASGTPYHYRVRAENYGGFSAYSNAAVAQTTPTSVPKPPSQLKLELVDPKPYDHPIEDWFAVLTWQDNADNEFGNLIERKRGDGEYRHLAVISFFRYNNPVDEVGREYVHIDSLLATGETYSWRIAALNANGRTDWQEFGACTVPGAKMAPRKPGYLFAEDGEHGGVELEWLDESYNEEGFIIEASRNGKEFFQAARTGEDVEAAEILSSGQGGARWFRVRTFNNMGTSSPSNAVRVSAP